MPKNTYDIDNCVGRDTRITWGAHGASKSNEAKEHLTELQTRLNNLDEKGASREDKLAAIEGWKKDAGPKGRSFNDFLAEEREAKEEKTDQFGDMPAAVVKAVEQHVDANQPQAAVNQIMDDARKQLSQSAAVCGTLAFVSSYAPRNVDVASKKDVTYQQWKEVSQEKYDDFKKKFYAPDRIEKMEGLEKDIYKNDLQRLETEREKPSLTVKQVEQLLTQSPIKTEKMQFNEADGTVVMPKSSYRHMDNMVTKFLVSMTDKGAKKAGLEETMDPIASAVNVSSEIERAYAGSVKAPKQTKAEKKEVRKIESVRQKAQDRQYDLLEKVLNTAEKVHDNFDEKTGKSVIRFESSNLIEADKLAKQFKRELGLLGDDVADGAKQSPLRDNDKRQTGYKLEFDAKACQAIEDKAHPLHFAAETRGIEAAMELPEAKKMSGQASAMLIEAALKQETAGQQR